MENITKSQIVSNSLSETFEIIEIIETFPPNSLR